MQNKTATKVVVTGKQIEKAKRRLYNKNKTNKRMKLYKNSKQENGSPN